MTRPDRPKRMQEILTARSPYATHQGRPDALTSSTWRWIAIGEERIAPESFFFEKSCFFVLLMSPSTVSMSFLRDVTTTPARRRQIVPISSVMVCKLSHQVGVSSDELANFIDQEHDPVLRTFGIQILLHPLAEVLDRHGELSSARRFHFSAATWLWRAFH